MAEKEDKITLQRDGENLRLHIPLKFKKRGGRKEIITPDGLPPVEPGRTTYQKPLVIALARAHRWQRLLETGEVASIATLAKRLKVDRSYVSRILELTLLAPDIVRAIMDGNEPFGLSLARLMKSFPVLWEGQCLELGFHKDLHSASSSGMTYTDDSFCMSLWGRESNLTNQPRP